ncbi:type II toxin-antitoxin system RelE/ParE family toxin [Brevundimonas goettingensis]|uniref:Type II toxin-antitoxin system RelE/ParE family toxin n=1 Tax=Brevundimonas goettingensis TaxID=2774190 RepID=A0A975C4Y6_9CAUL|nr:type II toxin-antitoxin system RelE/ParE family toxin [Brevundimonas goettingensis]
MAAFLEEFSSETADRGRGVLRAAIDSLAEMPERVNRVPGGDYRDLIAPFVAAGYAVRFRIEGEAVVIVRIFHTREDR